MYIIFNQMDWYDFWLSAYCWEANFNPFDDPQNHFGQNPAESFPILSVCLLENQIQIELWLNHEILQNDENFDQSASSNSSIDRPADDHL